MAQLALRKLIDPTDRHYSYVVPGIRANYMDISYPTPLFKPREQWSFPGWRYQDQNQDRDLDLAVVQNPTPFGYYEKVTSALTPMTQEGEPSALVPRTKVDKSIVVDQEAVASSTAIPDGNSDADLYLPHGKNKLIRMAPQKHLNLKAERGETTAVAPLRGGFFSNRLVEPGLACTTRIQHSVHPSKLGGAVVRQPVNKYWAQGFKTMTPTQVLHPEAIQMDVGQGTLGKRKERLDDEETVNQTLAKMNRDKYRFQRT